MKLELYAPVTINSIGQLFGMNFLPFYKTLGMKGHNGIDFSVPNGTIVRASHEGEVVFVGEDGAAGIGIVLRTLKGYGYKEKETFYKTIYWHLDKKEIFVKIGQKVEIGERLALSDNTGMSSGPHLHFGLKPIRQGENEWQWFNLEQDNGYFGAIDPWPFLNKKNAEDYISGFNKDMEFGEESEEVRKLQRLLASIGFFSGSQTGYYGEQTRIAVASFQELYTIPLSFWEKNVLKGKKCGPKTRIILNTLI